MKNMKRLVLTAALALMAMGAFAQDIAVFPFEDMENVLTRNEAVMFYREFSNEFSNQSAGKFTVVPRQEVEKLINFETAFQLKDYSAKAKTAEMERVLNGTQILSGLIGKLGNNIRVIVSLYTFPELRQLPGGATLSVANKTELFNQIPKLVKDMQDKIAGPAQPIPEGLEYEIVDVSILMNIRNNNFFQESVRLTNWARQSYEYGDYAASAGFTEEALRFADLSDEYVSSQLTESQYASIDGVLFDKNIRTLIKYPNGRNQKTYYVIPSSVTSIVDYAFYYCSIITGVSIPSSVKYIGDLVFSGCSNLTSITVDNRNTAYASIDGVLFDKNITTLTWYPRGRNQRTYVIPSSVKSIKGFAFEGCSSLTSITIPASVTTIESNAFSLCRSLTNITIPASVMTIGGFAFDGCSSLASITVDNRNTVYASVDGVLFDKNIRTLCVYPAGRKQTTYVIPSSVTSIAQAAFQGSNLTSITIPSSVTFIGEFAFGDSLTSVTLPRRLEAYKDMFPASARITYID